MRSVPRASRWNAEHAELAEKIHLRVLGALALVFLTACSGTSFFKQYEYEEDMYLSLDGSATLYVNSSLAALNALRGTAFNANPRAPFNREAIRNYYTSANTTVGRITWSRRNGRFFVHVRLNIGDVRQLGRLAPFAWSSYKFDRKDDQYVYEQTVGTSAGKDAGGATWTGDELVAFRLHLPSKITHHNTGRAIGRGNILVWEQSLTDRLHGAPLTLEARMQGQSILYRTLWLFGITFIVVVLVFVAVIWWIFRKGAPAQADLARKVG